MSSASRLPPGSTDSEQLARRAYADSRNLADRARIYQFSDQTQDLPTRLFDLGLSGTRVVDIGCGPGWYLNRAGELGLDSLGVELSLGMAREAAPLAPVIVADAHKLPIADASIDLVLMMHMLYHVQDIDLALEEAARIVTPDGTVVVGTNHRKHLVELRSLLSQALEERSIRTYVSADSHFDDVVARRVLDHHFAAVEVVDLRSTLTLPEPGPALAYIESHRHYYTDADEQVWADVVGSVDAAIERTISDNGTWRTTAHCVVYLCRPAARALPS